MSAGTLAAIGPDDIAAVRRSHPEAFTPPRTVAMRWIAWLGVVGYLAVSLHYFEVYKLFAASERSLALIRAFVVWEDMASWQ